MRKLASILICLLFIPYANAALSSAQTNSKLEEEEVLATSSKDVNQLVSLSEQQRNSLIQNTPFDPFFTKIHQTINKLDETTGVKVGFDYVPLYQHARHSPVKENASGGEAQLFGRWKICKEAKQSPTIGFKVEQRHRFTELYPSQLASQFNSEIKTVSGYEQLEVSITELWLQSVLIDKFMALRAGKLDMTSIMNTYAFDSRQFHFLSDVFSSEPAVNRPSKGLGAMLALKLDSHVYMGAGIIDLNGELSTSGFNTLHLDQFTKAFEIGYREKILDPNSDNYHFFLWHSDAQDQFGRPSDHGWSIVLQKNFNEKFIPFFKTNLNTGRVKNIKELYLLGFGYQYPFGQKYSLFGLAAGKAVLSDLSEKDKGHQAIVESFYRIQLLPFTQLTSDVQLLRNPTNDWTSVFNLRLRFAID